MALAWSVSIFWIKACTGGASTARTIERPLLSFCGQHCSLNWHWAQIFPQLDIDVALPRVAAPGRYAVIFLLPDTDSNPAAHHRQRPADKIPFPRRGA